MDKEAFIFGFVFFGVLTLSILLSIHMVNNDIEIDTTPLYWPETFPPAPEPDYPCYFEIEPDTIIYNEEGDIIHWEYHGKEGKSEYGEYDSN